ncbi:unnamed protein product, partial [Pleuronectes platessa]
MSDGCCGCNPDPHVLVSPSLVHTQTLSGRRLIERQGVVVVGGWGAQREGGEGGREGLRERYQSKRRAQSVFEEPGTCDVVDETRLCERLPAYRGMTQYVNQ